MYAKVIFFTVTSIIHGLVCFAIPLSIYTYFSHIDFMSRLLPDVVPRQNSELKVFTFTIAGIMKKPTL